MRRGRTATVSLRRRASSSPSSTTTTSSNTMRWPRCTSGARRTSTSRYSDHDYIAPDGFYVEATSKPDFSPERLRAQNYITNFLAARRTLVDAVGGFRDGYDGAHDHDLVLRLTAHNDRVARRSSHPVPLSQGRGAASRLARTTPGRSQRALARWPTTARGVGIDAAVETTAVRGLLSASCDGYGERPLVSIVIPTRGSRGVVWGIERVFRRGRRAQHRRAFDATASSSSSSCTTADTRDPACSMPSVGWRVTRSRRSCRSTVRSTSPTKVQPRRVAATRGRPRSCFLNDDTELIAPTSDRGPRRSRAGARCGGGGCQAPVRRRNPSTRRPRASAGEPEHTVHGVAR